MRCDLLTRRPCQNVSVLLNRNAQADAGLARRIEAARGTRRSVLQARERYGQLGLATYARYLLFRALGVVQMHVHQRPTDQHSRDGYFIDELRPGDVDEFRRRGVRDELLTELASEHTMALVHRQDGVANAFFMLGNVPFDFQGNEWLIVTPSPTDICGRYLWVAPEARGRGIDPALNVAADAGCRAAGYDHIVSTVSAFNAPSLRADAKIGYDRVVRLTAWRFLGICFVKFDRHLVVGRFRGAKPARFAFDTIRDFSDLAAIPVPTRRPADGS